jgi:hypothetical protein
MSNVLILADFVGSKGTKTNAELATVGARIGEVTAVVLAPAGKGAAMAAEINKGPVAKVVIVESDAFVNTRRCRSCRCACSNYCCSITSGCAHRITRLWQRGCCSYRSEERFRNHHRCG